jgi:hypothetical protein
MRSATTTSEAESAGTGCPARRAVVAVPDLLRVSYRDFCMWRRLVRERNINRSLPIVTFGGNFLIFSAKQLLDDEKGNSRYRRKSQHERDEPAVSAASTTFFHCLTSGKKVNPRKL